MAILAKTRRIAGLRKTMKTMAAKDAKYSFGRLIDLARTEPVTIAKHGRPVVVVMAVEEFERLQAIGASRDEKRREKIAK